MFRFFVTIKKCFTINKLNQKSPTTGFAFAASAFNSLNVKFVLHLSAALRSGLERRFYDDHDRKVNG